MLEKSLVYPVDANRGNIGVLIAAVEAFGEKMGASPKEQRTLTLLAEEVLSLLNSIVYVQEGCFFIEKDGSDYHIQLTGKANLDEETQMMLVESSSDGKNKSYEGVSGKIFRVIDSFFTQEACEAMTMASMQAQMGGYTPVYGTSWSLSQFYEITKEDTEEWDGLERSILLKLADDVLVGARGDKVNITIIKSFVTA